MNPTEKAMDLMRQGVPLLLLIDLALGVSADQILYDEKNAPVLTASSGGSR